MKHVEDKWIHKKFEGTGELFNKGINIHWRKYGNKVWSRD